MTHSLQARLVIRTVLLLAALMAIAAITIYGLMRASLVAELDAALLLEARSLTPHVELSGDGVGLEFELGQLPEYSRQEQPRYFEIWTHDGVVQGKSRSLGSGDLARPADASAPSEYQSVELPSGLAGRQLALRFQPRIEDEEPNYRAGGPEMTIVVARDTTELTATLAALAGLLSLVTLGTIVLSVVLLGRVIRRGLQPLNALATSIENVGVRDLSERVQLTDAPEEMMPVVQRLNGLLNRLDDTLRREKAFTAEVAHELRTPLAGLQAALEVCAARPRDPQDYRRTIAQCLRVTDEMHSMVQNLLVLARADAKQLKVEREPVDVELLVRECWRPLDEAARSKSLEVSWQLDPDGVAELDREKTRLVLRNLFENAVAHTQSGGWIRVTGAIDTRRCVITVANNGCQLPQADVAHVFNRFWRGDDARTDAGAHCGLGLALCQNVMELLGGSIKARIEGGQFIVTVIFQTALTAVRHEPAIALNGASTTQ